jgi:hypothetical protein
MAMQLPTLVPTPARVAALDRLGDEIAELSGGRFRFGVGNSNRTSLDVKRIKQRTTH